MPWQFKERKMVFWLLKTPYGVNMRKEGNTTNERTIDTYERDDDAFIEQAEYIEPEQLENWHISHPNERSIIRKLSQGGAKLLTGPRGCGKTTLLLHAHKKMCKEGKVFSAYVNFKSSLKVEPLYKKNINGSFWFKQWLIQKIYKGIYEGLDTYKKDKPISLTIERERVNIFIAQIESGIVEDVQVTSVTELENNIETITAQLKTKGCVLLLDDAAHAFSKDQQNDFFDFFRNIKSRVIFPKAAVYPGVTSYAASFHIGHDAEEIDVWVKTTDEHYVDYMMRILEKRVSPNTYALLSKEMDLLSVLCYASFGVPRNFLNLIRTLISGGSENAKAITVTRKTVMNAIEKNNEYTLQIYRSLKDKLPIYTNFITEGENIYGKMRTLIKQYNKGRNYDQQSVAVGINNPVPNELARAVSFLQYAGLLLYDREISRGKNTRYSIYFMNYGVLIENNVFGGKTSIKNKDLVKALSKRDRNAYKRVSTETLLGKRKIEDVFPLALPPCPNCGAQRMSPDTRFCSSCGRQLRMSSTFEELVKNTIDKLPITENRAESIRRGSSIRTIKDILIDMDHSELRSVKNIGPVWAQRIYSYAEEYIA